MKNIARQLMENRLESKKKELHSRKESFRIDVERDINSGTNFERNAINQLIIMLELESKIHQLEADLECLSLMEGEQK